MVSVFNSPRRSIEKYNIPAEVMQNSPLNLYGFSWDSSARFSIEQDKGFAPWWASDQIKTNFFRPLSSLTLALDFSLWPDTPLLMHIHSLLWFCLLIVLAYRLYRSMSGSAVVAGISILLLVVDDVFTGPVGWISNRHAVVAMVFCVLCVWLYHQGVSKQKWPYIAGACGVYALALLASEMGLVTFAYLFAYLLVLDRDKWLGRVKRIVPFVLITVVWRLAYTGLGYGASGTLLYIDPILNPVDFITQLLTRYPGALVQRRWAAGGRPAPRLLAAGHGSCCRSLLDPSRTAGVDRLSRLEDPSNIGLLGHRAAGRGHPARFGHTPKSQSRLG